MFTKCTAVALGALLLTSSVDESIAYGVEADTTLTRSISTSGDLELTFAVFVGDEEQDTQSPTIEIAYTEELVFVDTIQKVEDGRPTRLVREYRTMDSNRTIETPDDTVEETMNSLLLGESVVFTWDDDLGDWTASLPEDSDSDLDEDVLDDLSADLDLLALLPDGEIAVGAEWSVGVDLFHALNWPGGLLAYLGEDEDERDPVDLEASRQRFANAEATGTATLRSVEDGIATIDVSIEGTATAEHELDAEAEEGVPLESVTRLDEFRTELEVEVLWDLKAGHWKAFTIRDTTSADLDEVAIFSTPEGELEVIQRRSFTGDITVEGTCE